jgi:hypothetical protein
MKKKLHGEIKGFMGYNPGSRCMGLDISFVSGLDYSLKK